MLTNVNVDVVEPFAGGVTVPGLKPVPASTVPGKLRAVKLTPLLNPLILLMVIVYVVCCPCAIVLDEGDAEILKSPTKLPSTIGVSKKAPVSGATDPETEGEIALNTSPGL